MLYVGEEHGGFIPAGRLEEIKRQNPNVEVHSISGTEFRKRLTTRMPIPGWFSFTRVIDELQQFYKQNHERGLCVYFTGLPCSGSRQTPLQQQTAATIWQQSAAAAVAATAYGFLHMVVVGICDPSFCCWWLLLLLGAACQFKAVPTPRRQQQRQEKHHKGSVCLLLYIDCREEYSCKCSGGSYSREP